MNRDSLLDKIRALLNKTVANGCSEAEAMSALDKARAMMDAYEVTEDDLKLAKETAAVLHRESSEVRDPHNIRTNLAVGVAAFAGCKVWRAGTLVFCGLPSDVQFATWLLDTLTGFVQGELAGHLMASVAPRGERRYLINGFVSGCTGRITQRVQELARQAAPQANGRALVVVKTVAITEAMNAAGITLRSGRRSRRRVDENSYSAGRAAGDRASFGRPIGGGASAMIGR